MAITRLTQFQAEAEAFGKQIKVGWTEADSGDPSMLRISGLTLHEAEEVLNRVSTGRVQAVRPPGIRHDPYADLKARPPEDELRGELRLQVPEIPLAPPVETKPEPVGDLEKAKVEQPKADKKPRKLAPIVDVEPKAEAKSNGVTHEVTPKEEPKALESVKVKEEPKQEAKAADKAVAAAQKPIAVVETNKAVVESAAPATLDPADPDAAFLKAQKLKDVLYELQDRGFKDEPGMLKECERLKNKIPLLAKIANLPDRVHRTLEVMTGGVSA